MAGQYAYDCPSLHALMYEYEERGNNDALCGDGVCAYAFGAG